VHGESDVLTTTWLWLIPSLPLIGAVLLGLLAIGGSRSRYGASRGFASLLAVLLPVGSFAAVIAAALRLGVDPAAAGTGETVGSHQALAHGGWEWFALGDVALSFGLYFDQLTSLMLLFITGIGSLIVLYSSGYMAGDRGFCRFMSYLNLFLFSMIMLVLGDNLLVTFLGWEGVGLCSYLLIGFWHRDHANNDAARKAFIANRIGDLGFLLGVFALLAAMGESASLHYADIASFFGNAGDAMRGAPLLVAATLLIFVGCTGKSAQIPLMVWLPDAMAGPTPVSALIHAATMVTSGVFLLARLGDVYALTPVVLTAITVVALATALWAAIAGLFQWDIKKVLAYSTVSQLGFMFLAAGVGAFDVALFHVFTHAFFKATLFLGAGSAIHALHHEQDIRRMGGLARALPLTHAAMFFAWWAICGMPLGSGFFSKDLILEHALHDGGAVIYGIALGTALLTAVYMTRMMIYAFWSKPRFDAAHPPHEGDLRMILPVLLLGVGSLVAGGVWAALFGIDLFKAYLQPVLGSAQGRILAAHGHEVAAHGAASGAGATAWILAGVGVLVAVVGVAIAWARYRSVPGAEGGQPVSGFGAAWTWGFDRVYEALLVKPCVAIASVCDRVVDRAVIAPLVAGTGLAVEVLGSGYRWFQRRELRVSLLLSLIGVMVIVALVVGDILSTPAGSEAVVTPPGDAP